MDLTERQHASSNLRHPWEVSRFRFFATVVRDYIQPLRPLHILDAGAGDGWFAAQLLQELPNGSTISCWDAFYSDDDLTELDARTPPAITFHRQRPEGPFDLALALDVIEHVPDDVAFLKSIVAVMQPGAHVLISVPAYQTLFSSHDVALKHFRRYRPAQLHQSIADAGLARRVGGGLFHSLLPVRVLQKGIEVLRPRPQPQDAGVGRWTGGSLLTTAVGALLGADNTCSRIAARMGMPLPGLSCWALCRI